MISREINSLRSIDWQSRNITSRESSTMFGKTKDLRSLTHWKNQKFTLTNIFSHQINSLVLSFTLLSRFFCQNSMKVNFRNFHTLLKITEFYCHATGFLQKFRQINVLLKNFTTSKVSKMIIWKIQYFGVQVRSWVRLPRLKNHFLTYSVFGGHFRERTKIQQKRPKFAGPIYFHSEVYL